MLADENPDRVARLVISSCEAFDNYPPGLPAKNLRLTAMVPGGLFFAMQAMHVRRLRRLPVSFGWMSKARYLTSSSIGGCGLCRPSAACAATCGSTP